MNEAKIDKLIDSVGTLGGEMTQLASDNMRTQVLMEELRSQNEAVLEYVKDIPEIKDRLTKVEEKIDGLAVEMRLVKGVVREHSADMTELKSKSHSH